MMMPDRQRALANDQKDVLSPESGNLGGSVTGFFLFVIDSS